MLPAHGFTPPLCTTNTSTSPILLTWVPNLTEYNTAHNRRISMLGIADDPNLRKQKQGRKRRNVTFNDEEIIINPEDVDPNVGRFRNLVQTTVVPAKRARFEPNHMGLHSGSSNSIVVASHAVSALSASHQMFQQSIVEMKQQQQSHASAHSPTNSLYQGLPATAYDAHGFKTSGGDFEPVSPLSIGTKLGLLLPNPAPDVTPIVDEPVEIPSSSIAQKLAIANANVQRFVEDAHNTSGENDALGPQKKKYAKEAWPGRKPMLGQL
ncbi:nuclear inhibitor of protein phosphatase 1 isoform X2 [Scaptodrosophila lebanonensis]|uniref:Nuclear inhibitor of protein phosphatase 1 isoform X2 n=1 Tax=Drosophila lebanonensis TaxID=7225 RepID=A0A6J2TTQ3_DROLE|nr:nuclear inhibitor of protein phosphatase 1 isoform X2 [Scaptodrosophila lebanonensis]